MHMKEADARWLAKALVTGLYGVNLNDQECIIGYTYDYQCWEIRKFQVADEQRILEARSHPMPHGVPFEMREPKQPLLLADFIAMIFANYPELVGVEMAAPSGNCFRIPTQQFQATLEMAKHH